MPQISHSKAVKCNLNFGTQILQFAPKILQDPIFRMSSQRPNIIMQELLKCKGRCTIISMFITWVHLHFNTKWDPNFISTITPLRISRRKVDNNSENPSAKSFERELTLAPYLCQPDIKHIDYLFSL